MIRRTHLIRGAIAAAALAACAVLPLAPASAAGATQTLKKSMWGPTTLPSGASAFPTYRDLGVGIYQTQVHWYDVAPTRPAKPTDPTDPAYKWPVGFDKTIAEAQQNGMQVSIMLIGTPPWANGGKTRIWAASNPTDFGNFAAAVSKKYPSVHLWMIWGEPNRAPNFQPLTPVANTVKARTTLRLTPAQQTGPRVYAQLVDAAYVGLKGASPANKVIAGDTFTTAGPDAILTYQWIKYMKLPGGQRPRFDMWGHNPYGFDLPTLKGPPSPRGIVAFADLKRLMKALDKAFRPRKLPLFLSEWGVPIGFKDKDLLYSVPPKMGNKWIRAGFRIARTNRRIFTLGWVHLLDDTRSSQGLFTISGQKKPSYNFYKFS